MNYKNTSGFSLVEILSIIVLLSIVSVVVVGQLNLEPFRTVGFIQELRSAIRFAQKFAVESGCDVQVNVVAASNSYSLNLRNDAVATAQDCLSAVGAFNVNLINPASGSSYIGSAPNGVNVASDLSFFYDLEGRPSIAGGIITVDAENIVIENITGFVY